MEAARSERQGWEEDSSRAPARPKSKDVSKGSGVLIWIGLFKLLKCVMLLMVAAVTLRLAHGNLLDTLTSWVYILRVDPDNRFVHHVVSRLFATDPRKLDYLALGTLLYATIFAVEGIGLLLRKRWAEYFTTISTSLLIPLEFYELVHRANVVKAIVLAINVAVVVYLIYRIRKAAQPAALLIGRR